MTINGCNYNESAFQVSGAGAVQQLLQNAAAEPAPGQGRSAAQADPERPARWRGKGRSRCRSLTRF